MSATILVVDDDPNIREALVIHLRNAGYQVQTAKDGIEGGHAITRGRMLPYVMYIDPQLGRIGMTEEEARGKGLSIKVATMPMNYISRAVEIDESRGFMKAIVDAQTGQILGAAVLGIEGGELMSMIEIAMMGKVHYTVLKDAIFAHPTLAEAFNNLFGNFKS